MNKKLLEVLKGKKVTIIGHDECDVDSFISAKLLSNLLNYLNISNSVVILEQVKENDTYRLVNEIFNINLKDFYCGFEDENRILFLVDHYETNHLGNVVGCIDHHPNVKNLTYPYYYFRKSCSASYLIYELMQEFGYVPNEIEIKMIIISMMVDTVAFRSEKTITEEVVVAKSLARKYGIDYKYLEKYSLCLTDIENMNISEIINHGVKSYCFNGKKVKSSYLQLWDIPSKEDVNIWLETIKEKLFAEELEMWVFIIFGCKEEDTYEYHVTKDKISMRIDFGKILSRGTNIMPRIERTFYICH